MKKYIIFFCVGLFLVGCKSKKTVVRSGELRTKNVVSHKKKPKTKTYKDLPKDEGKFVSFKINSIQEYIDTFSEVAQIEMMAYGIPASITLAQGLLESGYGKGELAMKTNNHFGIKCHKGWEGDYDFHDDDEKGECFRKYNHPRYSYRDHSVFLTTRSRYAFLFNYHHNDYKAWARGLRKAGYATDVKYPQKLIYLIEKHNLGQYDTPSKAASRVKKQPVMIVASNQKTHIVQKGDTLYSISRKYFVSVEELMRINKMKDSNLAIGQKITVK
ncbi:glucosaminidase domain-containing protein [uncultured Maribacter sp.]|uniref:glucosaminidase domain-containing protein n=1 Tax=uncultured Maribacter sp. TaxID=431308 RepID=UPI00260D4941|nr:glucosaminidase domain-containing protein [uncultured Maribacter sp.]